ncbi:toll/interleukin-1 receptor domain-containing protein, partial [Gordonia aquimaris]
TGRGSNRAILSRMRLLDQMIVHHPEGERRIQLFSGDLAQIPDDEGVDALIVSAFPDSYGPTPGTLIRALDQRGLSVGKLARDKHIDLRTTSSCWLSRPVMRDDLGFRYVICFEPLYRGMDAPAQVVGDLFRSLVPFTTDEPWIRSIAMPLLAAGSQRESAPRMLRAILDASVHWLSAGVNLDPIKIVLYSAMPEETQHELLEQFRSKAKSLASEVPSPLASGSRGISAFQHDLFVSYSRVDSDVTDRFVDHVRTLDPSIRLYLDRSELQSGSSWQQSIYKAIDDSRFVVCLYSPDYLSSKVCIEELHIGWMRHREEGDVLVPAFLRSAQLPSYMRLVQYVDVREADMHRIDDFAARVVDRVHRARSEPRRRDAETAGPQTRGPSLSVGTAESLSTLVERLTDRGEVHLDVTIRLRDA